MRAGAVWFLLLVFAFAPGAAAQSLVYRIDRVIAVVQGDRLVVTAKGAVRSGGWGHARLVVRKAPPGTTQELRIAFLATPPVDKAAVAQAVVPVGATMKIRKPANGVTSVTVVSETNAVTVKIGTKKSEQRVARTTGS